MGASQQGPKVRALARMFWEAAHVPGGAGRTCLALLWGAPGITVFFLSCKRFRYGPICMSLTMPALPRYGGQASEGLRPDALPTIVGTLDGRNWGGRGCQRGLAEHSTAGACGRSGRWPCCQFAGTAAGGTRLVALCAQHSSHEILLHARGDPTLATCGLDWGAMSQAPCPLQNVTCRDGVRRYATTNDL
jgi:hypothetical protein